MAKQSQHLRRVALLIAGAFLVAAIAAFPAYAQQPPPLPQAFYGSAEVNGQPAAVGAQIEARGAGVKVGTLGNPLGVTVAGRYGGRTIAEPKLGVQGDLEDGVLIEFYIDGMKAECARPGGAWQTSYPFTSGVVTELNLRVSQAAQVTGTPTLTATPSATVTSTPIGQTGSTTSTTTPTAAVSARSAAGEPPTATRGSAGATLTPTPAQITMSTQSPVTVAALATATTQPAGVIVSTPTGLVAPSDPGTPTSLPAAQAQPPTATPSFTPEPVASMQQPTLTPVVVARAPAATSEPILKASKSASVARTGARSAPLPEDPPAARPLNLVMLGGGAALALAIAAGAAIIRVRSRPR